MGKGTRGVSLCLLLVGLCPCLGQLVARGMLD